MGDENGRQRRRYLSPGWQGQIGGIIRRELSERYELSGIDQVGVEGVPTTVADIADLNAILPAFEGIDAVVHLGADPESASIVGVGADLTTLLERGVCMRLLGCRGLSGLCSPAAIMPWEITRFCRTLTRPCTMEGWGRSDIRFRRLRLICCVRTATMVSARHSASRWGASSMTNTAYLLSACG